MKKLFLLIPLGVLLFSCASVSSPTPVSPSAKEKAVEARAKALAIKADTASKAEYEAAVDAFNLAAARKVLGADNGSQYQEAERLFAAAYDSAKSKRDEAQKQLDAARSAIKGVETQAGELERQGGGR
jgi:hypothetical protein